MACKMPELDRATKMADASREGAKTGGIYFVSLFVPRYSIDSARMCNCVRCYAVRKTTDEAAHWTIFVIDE